MALSSREAQCLAGGLVSGVAAALALQCVWRRPAAFRKTQTLAIPEEERVFLGIDLGGTTISVGLVDNSGSMVGLSLSTSLGEDHAPRVVCGKMKELAEKAVKAVGKTVHELAGIGLCTPGLLDCEAGVVNKAANLDGWQEVRIVEILAGVLGVDECFVRLENDGNTALLAEVWVGAARGRHDVVMLTLGTGVGSALWSGGRLVHGAHGAAGELGHAILYPDGRVHGSTGVKGIFEGYTSATAVAQRAAEAPPPKGSMLHGRPQPSCHEVFKAAEQQDAFALELIQDTARCLAVGCINVCRAVDPSIILFTGGMAQAGEFFFKEVREQFEKYHWNVAPVSCEFRMAECGNEAGIIGAAYAARVGIYAQYGIIGAGIQVSP